MAKIDKQELMEVRRKMGFYSINELSAMFDVGRFFIDEALNTGQLDYISPNGKVRFIKLDDYFEYIKKKERDKQEVKNG